MGVIRLRNHPGCTIPHGMASSIHVYGRRYLGHVDSKFGAPFRYRQSQKLCRMTSFLKATTSSWRACTREVCTCIFSSSFLQRACRFSTKAFCRFRHFVAAFRLSSSSRACLSERGVMRLEADFLGLAGVLRGRYESLDRSDVANDSLRMIL